jgi:ArsR family transcriptional regulator
MTADYKSTAGYYKALAHPARLQILDILRAGEACVCHIEAALEKRQAYVSQQLMILRQAGFVDFRKDGLQVYYRLTDPKISELLDVFEDLSHQPSPQRLSNCPCPQCSVVSIDNREEKIPC